MRTWEDLERRFRALEGSLRFARLDAQWGDGGEYWRVAGTADRSLARQLAAVAFMAGQKLDDTLKAADDPKVAIVLEEKDPTIRWYKALQHLGGDFKFENYGYLQNNQKETVGTIFTGTVNEPAAASATLCLEYAARYDESQGAAPHDQPSGTTINVSGDQSRVNINSTDSSSNVIASDHHQIFNDLRETIARQIPEQDQSAIMTAVDAMEAAVGTEHYVDRYKAFMSTVSDHITVLAPLLGGLVSLLG